MGFWLCIVYNLLILSQACDMFVRPKKRPDRPAKVLETKPADHWNDVIYKSFMQHSMQHSIKKCIFYMYLELELYTLANELHVLWQKETLKYVIELLMHESYIKLCRTSSIQPPIY